MTLAELDSQVIEEIVELRKQRVSIKDISTLKKIDILEVSELLKQELGSSYKEYYCPRGRKKISSEIVREIVKLRKQKIPLTVIHECKHVSIPTISRILKRELGESYDDYLCVKKIPITLSLRKRIVKLRKQSNSLKRISKQADLPFYAVRNILLEELGKEYETYSFKKISEVTNYVVNRIIRLRTKDRYTIKEISHKVKLTISNISKILKDRLKDVYSEYSTPQTFVSKNDVETIVQLRKKNTSLLNIREELKIPLPLISLILKCELKDKYKKYYARRITSHMRRRVLTLHVLKASPEEISQITNLSLGTINHIFLNPLNTIYNMIISEIQPGRADINLDDCSSFYQAIYNKIKRYTKYKNPLKLAPIAIFFYLKSRNVFVTTNEFIIAANLTRKEFRKGFTSIYPFCRNIAHINHRSIIYFLIDQIQEEFDLPDSFGSASKFIFQKFGHLLMNTKPEITAGVICILSLLKLKIHSVKLITICKTLGFQMSAALYQVNNNLLKRVGIKGFHGFRKTPQLIEPLLQEIPFQVSY